jgi:cell division protein YceG involved in septum cleavage
MKLFYVVLVILLFYNLGLTLYVFKINRRLKEFNQILLEIEKGQSKQKFLLKKNNRIDQVGFRVNSILYKYEKRIEVILSILVYTFFSRMFDLMLPPVAKHSIVVA